MRRLINSEPGALTAKRLYHRSSVDVGCFRDGLHPEADSSSGIGRSDGTDSSAGGDARVDEVLEALPGVLVRLRVWRQAHSFRRTLRSERIYGRPPHTALWNTSPREDRRPAGRGAGKRPRSVRREEALFRLVTRRLCGPCRYPIRTAGRGHLRHRTLSPLSPCFHDDALRAQL